MPRGKKPLPTTPLDPSDHAAWQGRYGNLSEDAVAAMAGTHDVAQQATRVVIEHLRGRLAQMDDENAIKFLKVLIAHTQPKPAETRNLRLSTRDSSAAPSRPSARAVEGMRDHVLTLVSALPREDREFVAGAMAISES